MEETTSREKVLKKIRSALISKNENPYPSIDSESSVYHDLPDTDDVTLAVQYGDSLVRIVHDDMQLDGLQLGG